MKISVLEGLFRNADPYYFIPLFTSFNILVYLSVASFVYSVRIINAKFFVCLTGGGKVGLIMSFKI